MEQKVLDQIHLCINELQMVKQLIDTKAADDFCSRMLGIYAMMRVDDIKEHGDGYLFQIEYEQLDNKEVKECLGKLENHQELVYIT